MSVILQLTPHDPLIARDGRPFGERQGNRMRGLSWPLPSVVAGSFRTALVKSNPAWDFTWKYFTETELKAVEVAGVLPVYNERLYYPAPLDCAYHKETHEIFRAQPQKVDDGCGTDLPEQLQPVMLTHTQAEEDFKAETPPAWWPYEKYVEWLTSPAIQHEPSWFEMGFLGSAKEVMRDHVKIDPNLGAAEESQIFSTANLHVSYLPRFRAEKSEKPRKFQDRFAEITLSARVTLLSGSPFSLDRLTLWHPLGGERRLVHWQQCQQAVSGWTCPPEISTALSDTKRVRLILATPAIFQDGWKPDLTREPFTGLTLVGACTGRWKAVSGWDLQKRGPKPIRRMVPAGSVYFFECQAGSAAKLANYWLQSVSDDPQDQRDGFGLALWGTW